MNHRRYQKFKVTNKGVFKIIPFAKVLNSRLNMNFWKAIYLAYTIKKGVSILIHTKTQNESTDTFITSLHYALSQACKDCVKAIESVSSVQTVKADLYKIIHVFRRPPSEISNKRLTKKKKYDENQIEVVIYSWIIY